MKCSNLRRAISSDFHQFRTILYHFRFLICPRKWDISYLPSSSYASYIIIWHLKEQSVLKGSLHLFLLCGGSSGQPFCILTQCEIAFQNGSFQTCFNFSHQIFFLIKGQFLHHFLFCTSPWRWDMTFEKGHFIHLALYHQSPSFASTAQLATLSEDTIYLKHILTVYIVLSYNL